MFKLNSMIQHFKLTCLICYLALMLGCQFVCVNTTTNADNRFKSNKQLISDSLFCRTNPEISQLFRLYDQLFLMPYRYPGKYFQFHLNNLTFKQPDQLVRLDQLMGEHNLHTFSAITSISVLTEDFDQMQQTTKKKLQKFEKNSRWKRNTIQNKNNNNNHHNKPTKTDRFSNLAKSIYAQWMRNATLSTTMLPIRQLNLTTTDSSFIDYDYLVPLDYPSPYEEYYQLLEEEQEEDQTTNDEPTTTTTTTTVISSSEQTSTVQQQQQPQNVYEHPKLAKFKKIPKQRHKIPIRIWGHMDVGDRMLIQDDVSYENYFFHPSSGILEQISDLQLTKQRTNKCKVSLYPFVCFVHFPKHGTIGITEMTNAAQVLTKKRIQEKKNWSDNNNNQRICPSYMNIEHLKPFYSPVPVQSCVDLKPAILLLYSANRVLLIDQKQMKQVLLGDMSKVEINRFASTTLNELLCHQETSSGTFVQLQRFLTLLLSIRSIGEPPVWWRKMDITFNNNTNAEKQHQSAFGNHNAGYNNQELDNYNRQLNNNQQQKLLAKVVVAVTSSSNNSSQSNHANRILFFVFAIFSFAFVAVIFVSFLLIYTKYSSRQQVSNTRHQSTQINSVNSTQLFVPPSQPPAAVEQAKQPITNV